MTDDQRWADWVERLEDPIWESLEAVYERAKLSPEEAAALDEYRNVTEYFLLRAKIPMVTGIQGPSLIRQVAGLLRFLNGPCVCGADGRQAPRQSFVKEMFRDRPVHMHVETRPTRRGESGELEQGRGVRFRARSTAFWDKLAELRVLAFLCVNGYRVEFPSSNAEGQQPEFFIRASDAPVGVEVKNLDSDAVLDRIFGGFDHEPSLEASDGFNGPDDREGIVGMIQSQYENAAAKFREGPAGIIVVFVPIDRSAIDEYLDPWLTALRTSWQEGSSPRVGLLVLATHGTVEVLANSAHQELLDHLRFDALWWDELWSVYQAPTPDGPWQS